MKKKDKKPPKEARQICFEIWKISNELNGLGSLFLYQSRDVCLEAEELSGVGNLIQDLSKELEQLEGTLREEVS